MVESRKKNKSIHDLQSQKGPEKAELIGGEIHLQSAPSPAHGLLQGRISGYLHQHAAGTDKEGRFSSGWVIINEAGVYYDELNAFEHDVAAWKAERLPQLPTENYIKTRPDLVVEVLSESNWWNDTLFKRDVLMKYSAPYYWMVQPQLKQLLVFKLQQHAYEVLGQFSSTSGTVAIEPIGSPLDLAKLFAY